MTGNIELITVMLCPVLLLINDIYGTYNWRKIKNEQKGEWHEQSRNMKDKFINSETGYDIFEDIVSYL